MLFEDEDKERKKNNITSDSIEPKKSEETVELKQEDSALDEQAIKVAEEKKKKLIEELEKKILEYQHSYYNKTAQVSDEEFDALWDRLRALDINNKVFSDIGKDRNSFFEKKDHIMPMGSLDKVSNTEQCNKWLDSHPSPEYIIQHKLDGASLELQYQKGILVAALTRGDGKKGDDILINVRKMKGIVKKLNQKLDIAIRGEVIMTHDVFAQHFSDKANCRNAANGLMKRKDGLNAELLNVFCYDIWFSNPDHEYSEIEKLDLLKTLGFRVVDYVVLSQPDDIHKYRLTINDKRKVLGYDIDGLVIKLPYGDADDMKTLRPDRQIAYKFPLEYAQTKLLDIEWSESGHLYTPVGILEPVQLAGTTVKRANLVHINHIRDLDLRIGSEVLVVKRGEIIPKIEKVIVNEDTKKNKITEIDIPSTCSTCGSILNDIGTRLFCPNLECKKRLLFRALRWCDILEIDFWGEALFKKLILENELIKSMPDLYKLNKEQIMSTERMGDALANKLLKELHSKTHIDFEKFIAALGIDGVALVTAEKIIEAGYSSIEKIKTANEERLSEIDSIGPIIAKNIHDFFEFFTDEIQELAEQVSFVEIEDKSNLPLYGLSFCFTGTMSLSRKEAQELAKKNGGSIKSSISKDLSYLVANNQNSTSEKMKKASALGIKLINEQEFLDLIQ